MVRVSGLHLEVEEGRGGTCRVEGERTVEEGTTWRGGGMQTWRRDVSARPETERPRRQGRRRIS